MATRGKPALLSSSDAAYINVGMSGSSRIGLMKSVRTRPRGPMIDADAALGDPSPGLRSAALRCRRVLAEIPRAPRRRSGERQVFPGEKRQELEAGLSAGRFYPLSDFLR